MNRLQQNLRPIRIQRLRQRARMATDNQDWRQAAETWNKLLGLEPDDPQAEQGLRAALRNRAKKAHGDGFWGEEIGAWEVLLKLEPGDEEAQEQLPIAEHNQQWAYKYRSAQDFVQAGKLAAAKAELELLWSQAPDYGDHEGIVPSVGLVPPPSYEEQRQIARDAEAALEAAKQAGAKQQAEREAAANKDKESPSKLVEGAWGCSMLLGIGAVAFFVLGIILGGVIAAIFGDTSGFSQIFNDGAIAATVVSFFMGVVWAIGGGILWGIAQINTRFFPGAGRLRQVLLPKIGILAWCIASAICVTALGVGAAPSASCPSAAFTRACCGLDIEW